MAGMLRGQFAAAAAAAAVTTAAAETFSAFVVAVFLIAMFRDRQQARIVAVGGQDVVHGRVHGDCCFVLLLLW